MAGGESWREAFPEVPTNELDAPGLWSDPNFSLSKSASIGKFWRKERERERNKKIGLQIPSSRTWQKGAGRSEKASGRRVHC